VCNSVSSVLAEANLLGKPTICLLDNEGDDALVKQEKMAAYPELVWHDYFERSPFSSSMLECVAATPIVPKIKPFDFELVRTLVDSV